MAGMNDGTPGPRELELRALCAEVRQPDPAGLERAWERLDSLTKPPRSLGRLEEVAARMATVQQTTRPEAAPTAIVLFAGDHGVVAEGVSAWPAEVTRQMMANFVAGGAAINQLAAHCGARLVLVDVGVAGDTTCFDGVVQAKVCEGTRNMVVEPAMTREEAADAFLVGATMVRDLAAQGYRVIATGEMGIGNSTVAAALSAAYTDVPVSRVVGRGTGVDDVAYARKQAAVDRALRLHRPRTSDALGTLASLGGLEIAAMAGAFVGGAASGVCMVSDGFISSTAALAAAHMSPESLHYVFASHLSREPGHRVTLVPLGLEPYLDLDMRLGEGTGAALGLGFMAAACAVMNGMATFAEAGVAEREESPA